MATHLVQPNDFDAEVTRRVIRHEKQLKGSVLAFAIAVVAAAAIWISFLSYL